MAEASGGRKFFQYTAAGGGHVRTPARINPHRELGLSSRASARETKAAYRKQASTDSRQGRVMASISYHIITSTVDTRYKKQSRGYYTIKEVDQFVLAAAGFTEELLKYISDLHVSLGNVDEHGRTSLYIAARSGFYDTTRALLEAGAPVNQRQLDGSTPLHGAAYYGQIPVVKLLLSCGADPTIKNSWGSIASEETKVDGIKKLFIEYKEDKIANIARTLISKELATNMVAIFYKDSEVARKIVRDYRVSSDMTRQNWEDIKDCWESSWHGTKAHNITSIFTHGLIPSGEMVDGHKITPPANHFKLGVEYFDKPNWAAAIFVSPSLLYASHACYAERLLSNGVQWCVVVRARVKPGSYSEHSPTTLQKPTPIVGEPTNSEYRIDASDEDKIRRIESSRNVVVTSVVFIEVEFLEKISKMKELNYESTKALWNGLK